MSEYERRKKEAESALRKSEAKWTPDIPEEGPPPPDLTTEEASLLVTRYGGQERLSEGIESLADAMEALEPLLRDRGDWAVFGAVLWAADRERERAGELERVLEKDELRTSGGKIVVSMEHGRPPHYLRVEVELAFGRQKQKRGFPVGKGNEKEIRKAIREELLGRFSEEELSDSAIQKIIGRINTAWKEREAKKAKP